MLSRSYRSTTVWQSHKPRWPAFDIALGRLCAGLLDNQLRFEVYDWSTNGDHVLLGSVSLTARELVSFNRANAQGLPLVAAEGAAGCAAPARPPRNPHRHGGVLS